MNNEPLKLMKSRIREPEAVSFRTGTMEKRAEVGKGGQEIGKWCSFSHLETTLTRLFQHNSTQVVDFPHLSTVRFFWGRYEMVSHGWNTDKTRMGKDHEPEGTGNAKEHKERKRWEIQRVRRGRAADAFAFWWRFS